MILDVPQELSFYLCGLDFWVGAWILRRETWSGQLNGYSAIQMTTGRRRITRRMWSGGAGKAAALGTATDGCQHATNCEDLFPTKAPRSLAAITSLMSALITPSICRNLPTIWTTDGSSLMTRKSPSLNADPSATRLWLRKPFLPLPSIFASWFTGLVLGLQTLVSLSAYRINSSGSLAPFLVLAKSIPPLSPLSFKITSYFQLEN